MTNPDETPKSTAQLIFEGKQLLNERPSEMPYELYRQLRRIQTRIIKDIFRRKPDRKLQFMIPQNQPKVRITPGFKKVQVTRKAS